MQISLEAVSSYLNEITHPVAKYRERRVQALVALAYYALNYFCVCSWLHFSFA